MVWDPPREGKAADDAVNGLDHRETVTADAFPERFRQLDQFEKTERREQTRYHDAATLVVNARRRMDAAKTGVADAFASILDDAASLDWEFQRVRDRCTDLEKEVARLQATRESTEMAGLRAANELLKARLVSVEAKLTMYEDAFRKTALQTGRTG